MTTTAMTTTAMTTTHSRHEGMHLLGLMTAGISHDLRNVLNGLSLQLQVLERCELKKADESLQHLRRGVAVGIELLDHLRELSGAHAQQKVSATLAALAHEACELSRMSLRSPRRAPITIREVHAASCPPVRVHRGEVLSAVINLVLNAADAMPSGGTIEITTGAARGGAWVRVSDQGPGIPPALQRSIFQPFFTTKGSAGSGLGLAQVRQCMRRHAGSVHLQTRPGHGAAFTLWLPAGEARSG
jgi:signal transduction histidine kinase